MEQLKRKPLRGYKKIVRLGEKMENPVHSLYKYMNVQRAIEFLESGDYYFVEPIEWADPYEKRFYTADYSSLRYTPKQCFCTCLTHKISSEAAVPCLFDDPLIDFKPRHSIPFATISPSLEALTKT